MVFKDITVSCNWAEWTFSIVALSYAQCLGYAVSKPLTIHKQLGKQYTEDGFVDTSLENVTVMVDDIRYN